MTLWLQSLFSDKLIRYGVYALVFFVLIIVEGNLTGQLAILIKSSHLWSFPILVAWDKMRCSWTITRVLVEQEYCGHLLTSTSHDKNGQHAHRILIQ